MSRNCRLATLTLLVLALVVLPTSAQAAPGALGGGWWGGVGAFVGDLMVKVWSAFGRDLPSSPSIAEKGGPSSDPNGGG